MVTVFRFKYKTTIMYYGPNMYVYYLVTNIIIIYCVKCTVLRIIKNDNKLLI